MPVLERPTGSNVSRTVAMSGPTVTRPAPRRQHGVNGSGAREGGLRSQRNGRRWSATDFPYHPPRFSIPAASGSAPCCSEEQSGHRPARPPSKRSSSCSDRLAPPQDAQCERHGQHTCQCRRNAPFRRSRACGRSCPIAHSFSATRGRRSRLIAHRPRAARPPPRISGQVGHRKQDRRSEERRFASPKPYQLSRRRATAGQ